tara:strand:- start:556 stop:915 length:360 start_codon:yes stop_codon:yes gene_type:complete
MSTKFYETMVAREDLSDAQYKILNVHDANGVKLRVAAGAGVLGVLDNKPQDGENATVVTMGRTKCFAGATITAGSFITVTASGTATAVASGQYILGKALTGCASGSTFELSIQHNGYRG